MFSKRSALTKHQRSHEDEWPFACCFCCQEFKYQSSLSRHIKEQHFGQGRKSQNFVPNLPQENLKEMFYVDNENDVRPTMVEEQRWLPSSDVHNFPDEMCNLYQQVNSNLVDAPLITLERQKEYISTSNNLPSTTDSGFNCNRSQSPNIEGNCLSSSNDALVASSSNFDLDSCSNLEGEEEMFLSPVNKNCHKIDPVSEYDFPITSNDDNGVVQMKCINDSVDCSVFRHWKAQHYDSGRKRSGWNRIAENTTDFHYRERTFGHRCNIEEMQLTNAFAHDSSKHLIETRDVENCCKTIPLQTVLNPSLSNEMRDFDSICKSEDLRKNETVVSKSIEEDFDDIEYSRDSKISVNLLTSKDKEFNENVILGDNHDCLTINTSEECKQEFAMSSGDSIGSAVYKVDTKPCVTDCVLTSQDLSPFMSKKSRKKRHSCQVCGKVFNKKHELRKHWIVHSDERSFVCKLCFKDFKYKGSLVRHIKEQHYGLGRKKANRALANEILREMNSLMCERVKENELFNGCGQQEGLSSKLSAENDKKHVVIDSLLCNDKAKDYDGNVKENSWPLFDRHLSRELKLLAFKNKERFPEKCISTNLEHASRISQVTVEKDEILKLIPDSKNLDGKNKESRCITA